MNTPEEMQAWEAEREAQAQAVRDRITAAGISYPLNWDEMGSSAKDMWEERTLRGIERRSK